MVIGNVLLVGLFLIFSIYLYNEAKEYFPFIIPIWFMHAWMIISVAYLENGCNIVYHMTTYYTGATLRLVILEFTFFLALIFGIRLFSSKFNKSIDLKIAGVSKNFIMNSWMCIIFFAALILLIDTIISGNVLTNKDITRFNFYKDYSKLSFVTWAISLFIDFLNCLNGILFLEYLKTKRKRKIKLCIFILLITIVYKYLIGVEFGGYFYLIVLFTAPLLLNYKKKRIPIFTCKNVITIIVLLLLVLIPKIMFFSTSSVYSGVSDSAIGKFQYRALALQGEVWWGVDNKYINNQINSNGQLQNEISAFLNDTNRYSAGIWYLSYLILPNYDHQSNDATLNCGYPAINLAIFGYQGALFFQIINGLIFALSVVYLHNKVLNQQYLSAFFGCGVWFMLYDAFYMGGLWYLGGTTMKLSLFSIVIIEISVRILRKKYRKIT